eukprot:CAMPEP_0206239550 /NCGR_PEP_ID=MMETSP0047_2-20121206/15449_1 /ASSEMBLY_ACC=CAM_ASM_000192 /TAXON_ID=195065 /ORGANISM="Chroomonas mesostigmatica_cf, Strain CCMP1168" /LENGTH=238 /DNA_ID=CAMNT_0053664241 /DNA_START=129 /DNA_END=845 /DNA_ORIENTATION=-
MATRTASSNGATTDSVRKEMHDAFHECSHNGILEKAKLPKTLQRLGVNLKLPNTDMDAIFAFLDLNGNGEVPYEEFEKAIEPTLQAYHAKGFPLVVDEIVKEAFKAPIKAAEDELAMVDKSFIIAHSKMVKEGHAFGVDWWGENWRFKMFQEFYEKPKDLEGNPISYKDRLAFLKERLHEIDNGDMSWVAAITRNPKFQHEIPNQQCWDGVREYADLWLVELGEKVSGFHATTEKPKK